MRPVLAQTKSEPTPSCSEHFGLLMRWYAEKRTWRDIKSFDVTFYIVYDPSDKQRTLFVHRFTTGPLCQKPTPALRLGYTIPPRHRTLSAKGLGP